jgi:tetratricopeptide (TPR) repeat protein
MWDNDFYGVQMKARVPSIAAACLLFGAALSSSAAPQAAPAASTDNQADAYFNFMMGHLYEGDFRSSNQKADADRAVEYYKRAYALNPSSAVIGEQLAEMYFVSQQLADAIVEAQSVLRRDPDNLPVRRLLSRIYIRSLGNRGNTNAEQATRAGLAIEQLREIVRLDPDDTDSALWLARLYRVIGQDNPAEQTLRGLLARDSDNISGVAQLAQLLVDHNNLGEAVPLLENFLKDTPNDDLYDLLGDAYTRMNNLSGAEEAYRHAVQMEPERARHVRGLAQVLFNQGRYPEALAQYQRLVELRPDDADNYLRMSIIYRRLQRLDDAERQILQARQHAPDNLEVIYNQATLYEDQGRFEDAIGVASDAIHMVMSQQVAPTRRRNLAVLYQLQGQLNRDAGNYPAAINSFQELQKLGPEEDQRARLLIVESYRDARDLPSAFSEMTKALGAYPNDRSLRVTQALLYGQNGQPDLAAQSLRALLTATPADLDIQIDLVEVYLENRRYAQAEEAIRGAEALGRGPEDKQTTDFLRGSLYERQGKYDQAEQAFKDVLAANPRHAGALNYYGYMLADRGVRLDEAVALIGRALAEDPNNANYLDSMGWVRFKQNRLQEAEEYLRKAVSRNSHNPEMLGHLGDILAKSGRDDLAAAQWEKALAEWRRALPAEQEPAKITELEQKLSRLKNRVAQQAAPAEQPR